MLKEFTKFIQKGNVLDLAVAVIIGGAFGAITTSLVNDLLMPLIGIILGGVDFTALKLTVGNAELLYGNFLQAVVNFLIIAFSMFLVVKAFNQFQKAEEEAPAPAPEPSAEEKLLMEIRDLLKSRQ
jgi:large conductance mechanosensitive channel